MEDPGSPGVLLLLLLLQLGMAHISSQHGLLEDDESPIQTQPDGDDDIRDRFQSAQSQPRAPRGLMSFQRPSSSSFFFFSLPLCSLGTVGSAGLPTLHLKDSSSKNAINPSYAMLTCENTPPPTMMMQSPSGPISDKYDEWCYLLHPALEWT